MSNDLAKAGGEAIGLVATELKDNETGLLTRFDAVLEKGEHDLADQIVTAVKDHGGLAGKMAGGTVGNIITAALDGVTHAVEGGAKTIFDKIVAAMEAKAAELEA